MRLGETFAIDLNEDVDFKKHELRINGQMRKMENKTWYINPPKYGQLYLKTYLLPDKSITQIRADVDVPYKEIMPSCVIG